MKTALVDHREGSYEHLLWQVRHAGDKRRDRTGTGTLSLFAPPALEFDLDEYHVPLITSKRVYWENALKEFMWMLSGSTSTADLRKRSPKMADVWDLWAKDGDIGPTYGAQYRNAGGSLQTGGDVFPSGDWAVERKRDYGVDQLARTVNLLAQSPDTRRAVISLWSVPELQDMALEPCMVLFQFSLRGENYDELELHVYQRSADLMLGVPFDLFQAGFLAHAVARELRLMTGRKIEATRMVWSAGDVHVYSDQLEAVDQVLWQDLESNEPEAWIMIDPFPSLRLLNNTLEAGHVKVYNYNPQPAVSAPIAV